MCVLFLATEPFDYEAEELSIIQASEGLDMSIAICESGTIDELKALMVSFRPHLMHLVAQAKMSGGGNAVISLPGSDGRTDQLFAEELATALQGSGAAGIILAGRQSEPAPLHLLCQKLAESIPLALASMHPPLPPAPLPGSGTGPVNAGGCARLYAGRPLPPRIRFLLSFPLSTRSTIRQRSLTGKREQRCRPASAGRSSPCRA